MKYNDLSDLPEWDDDEFKEEDEEGEEWKPNPTRDACKALYQQWQQVMIVLNGGCLYRKHPGFAGMLL